MKRTTSQIGASIVEILITATIFLIFVTGVLGLFLRSGSSLATKFEKNKAEQDKETIGSLIKPDFENAGSGIASFSNHAYGTSPARFDSNTSYLSSGEGMLIRMDSQSGENPESEITAATRLGSATGSVTVKLSKDSYVRLSGEQGSDVSLQASSDGFGKYRVAASINTEIIDLGEHLPGTTYRIGLTPDPEGKAVVINQISDGQQTKELLRRNQGIPQGIIAVSAYIKTPADYIQINMTGAPLIDTSLTTFSQTSLFFDSEIDSVAPKTVYQHESDKSVTIIGSDLKTGISFLQQPISGLNGQNTIYISKPEKGAYKRADYCLIIDYQRGSTALVEIIDVADSSLNSQAITVIPVTGVNNAWNRFYSTSEAIEGSFAAGSKFLKLAIPVTYRISEDDRLVREVGGRSETAAFNVKNFNFTEMQTGNGPSYRIELQIATDGRMTDRDGTAPTLNYTYTATPRALNVANKSE